MSKEIFLYSKNKKYKCAVELADSCDHFGCPDNSVMILFEERKDGTYIIAQARDKRLETEKDRIIADLEKELAGIKAKFAQNKAEKEKSDKLLNIIKKEAKNLQKTIEYWQELGATNSGLDAVGYQMIINAIRSQTCEELEKAISGLVYQNENKETFINGDIYEIIEKVRTGKESI